MTFKKFIKELNGNRVEGQLLKLIFYSIFASFISLILLYYFLGNRIENLFFNYGIYLFFAIIIYSLISAVIHQVRAYGSFACMSGMMIGMTTGMIAGFMSGYFIGATNGMFIGSLFGIVVGSVLGIWTGSCCGIMGFMEGIMAGFMGGLMGAMTAIMMLNDNLLLATILVFIVCVVILISLNYMIYFEMKENDIRKKLNPYFTIIFSIVLTLLTTLVMVFGYRSGIVG